MLPLLYGKYISPLFPKMPILSATIVRSIWSSVGEWLGYSLLVLGVDGSSLLTASQRCDDLNSSYA